VERYKQAILAAAFRGELAVTKQEALNTKAIAALIGDIADIQSGSGFPREVSR
jgi:hypothetical protein